MRIEAIAWFDMPNNGKWHGQSVMPQQELVRCRDCKYFGNKVRVGDTFVCNKHGIYVPKDGFCSEGKAK